MFLGSFCSVIGAACLVFSGLSAIHARNLLFHAVRAKGIIVEMLPVKRIDGGVTPECAPVFRFQTEDGQSYTIRANATTNPPELRIGDAVTVFYDRGNPKGANLDSFKEVRVVPVILLAIGVGYGLGGILTLYSERRYQKGLAAPVDAVQPL